MKRTSLKNKPELKRRLQLVRTTIRELTPSQLASVNGGYAATDAEPLPSCVIPYTKLTESANY